MSYLFHPIKTQLNGGRLVTIVPLCSFGINADGWHNAGVYQITVDECVIGEFIFEGTTKWHHNGNVLTEIEQEELAYFIRFYNGKAA